MSAKTQHIQEEQLTAFVMGELNPEEQAAVERAMAEDPALKGEVEALRQFCGDLWQELKAEPAAVMSLEQKAVFAKRLSPWTLSKSKSTSMRWLAVLTPLAAAAVATFLVWPKVQSGDVLPKLGSVGSQPKEAAVEVRHVPAPVEEDAAPAILAVEKSQDATSVEDKRAKKDSAHKPAEAVNLNKLGLGVGSLAGVSSGSGVKAKTVAGAGKSVALNNFAGGTFQPREESRQRAAPEQDGEFNTEAYDLIAENPFKSPAVDPLSTFSVDVDTASYANVRRFITSGQLPPKDAVRIEELLNYFRYDYATPAKDRPFSVNVEVTEAPWAPKHRLMRIGLKGKDIAWADRPAANLVFLIDVSGSMDQPNKLPLVKQAFKLMVDQLGARDQVAIVVYAGASGLVLPSTAAADKTAIIAALDRLGAGGSTNGGEGLKLAYLTAQQHFVKGGINRVVIATDGDFNVGTTSQGDLVRLIEEKAKSGVFLSVLGFGMGNYKDSTLEMLADKGNGNYAYIDTATEARKALVEEIGGTLVTIAKDVKLQLEFNPNEVNAYRLIGYENRVLAHQDFNNDQKDAGDIGAGHVVTALYEVVPKDVAFKVEGVDALKYQQPATGAAVANSGELLTLKLRYKEPQASKSSLDEFVVRDDGGKLSDASQDTRFAAGVAAFGMLLRDSEHKGDTTFDSVLRLAEPALGDDKGGYRQEFVDLVKKAKGLQRP